MRVMSRQSAVHQSEHDHPASPFSSSVSPIQLYRAKGPKGSRGQFLGYRRYREAARALSNNKLTTAPMDPGVEAKSNWISSCPSVRRYVPLPSKNDSR